MYILLVREKFDAAHRLKGYKGDCAHLHGHTWRVDVKIETPTLDELGIAIDFKALKRVIKSLLPDHDYLNKVYKFNPTAEKLSNHLYYKIKKKLSKTVSLLSVTVWESENACATYFEGE
jgi:6-pyruvoyltetrahydropterin/6-carboxytetrahydropterin synthase